MKNKSEQDIKQRFKSRGYKCLRGGAPDFVFYKEKNSKICEARFIEVKSNGREKLFPNQLKFKKIIESFGIDYELIVPNKRYGKVKIGISLDKNVIKEINNIRGEIPFSAYINRILKKWKKIKLKNH